MPFRISAIAAILICCSAVLAAPIAVPFAGIPKTELSFDLGYAPSEWSLQSREGNSAVYTSQGHTLSLNLEKRGDQKLLRFVLAPPAGQKLSVKSYSAVVHAPKAGLHSVMDPAIRPIGNELGYLHQNKKWREGITLYRCLTTEGFEEEDLAQNGNPFILLSDNRGNNRLLAGWARADTATRLAGKPGDDVYTLTLTRQEDVPFAGDGSGLRPAILSLSKDGPRPTAGDSLKDALIISTARKPWLDVEREYAKTFDRFNGRMHSPTPAWATEPQYCTWYCYLHEINADLILKSAKKCSELGIGVYLIDAGWDPKPGVWWGDLDNGTWGDFTNSPDRFPNLRENVKQMQDMGLKVLLWTAPFWQARKSETYLTKTKDWHAVTKDGERYDLCPKYPGTRELFKEQYAKVARDYGVDGMWIDVADAIPAVCSAKHEHLDQTMGDAWLDCMMAVRDGLRSVNPEAITEARILHANMNGKYALDVVQCGDSPETHEVNRLANIHIRPWAYDVVLKIDPVFWPKGTSAAEIGKHLATMVCSGVPDISVDFVTVPEEEFRMVRAWLDFYREHKATLLRGKFSLFGEDYGIPDMLFVGDREAIVYMKNDKTREVVLPRGVRRVTLLNCTDSDTLDVRLTLDGGWYSSQVFKPDWSRTGSAGSVHSDGKLWFGGAVPQGGAVVIKGR